MFAATAVLVAPEDSEPSSPGSCAAAREDHHRQRAQPARPMEVPPNAGQGETDERRKTRDEHRNKGMVGKAL